MSGWRVVLAGLAAGVSSAALAAPAEAPNPIFTGGDLFNLSAASDVQISPDGKTIAYVRQSNDIMTDKAVSTIWLVDVASGQQRPLVTGKGSHVSPRWSPDGRRLAYVSTDGSGAPQLFVRWMSSGEASKVTGLPDSPNSLSWYQLSELGLSGRPVTLLASPLDIQRTNNCGAPDPSVET